MGQVPRPSIRADADTRRFNTRTIEHGSDLGLKPIRSSLPSASAVHHDPELIRRNRRGIDLTKKYVKDEAISYPSPVTSQDENSFLSHSGSPYTFLLETTGKALSGFTVGTSPTQQRN